MNTQNNATGKSTMKSYTGSTVRRPSKLAERENIHIAGYSVIGKYKNGSDFSAEAPRLIGVMDQVKAAASELDMASLKYYSKSNSGQQQEINPNGPAEESKMPRESRMESKIPTRMKLMKLFEKYEGSFNKEYDMSRSEKSAFMETIRNYQRYGETIYRSKEMANAVNEIAQMVETANSFTLKETDGWFDNVTANRHTKQMNEAVKVLQTEAKEIMQRQQRLEAAYEDIGQLLGRYYEV